LSVTPMAISQLVGKDERKGHRERRKGDLLRYRITPAEKAK
jgi:hypothetical protein